MSIVIPSFARTTLRAAITPSSTSLSLASGGGAYFNIGSGNYVYITISDGNSVEVVKYTSGGVVVNDTIEVERAQCLTSAKSFPAGACVQVAWPTCQVYDLVVQTYYELFNADALPPNTTIVTAVPVAPPQNNVIYAVWVTQHRLFYWTGASWVELGNIRNGVLAGNGDPSGTPNGNVAFYVNTANGALFYWTGSAWLQVSGDGSTEEYWVRGARGELYILPSETQVELGVISMTNRYRTYPNGVAGNTILQIINQGGSPRTTLLEDAAMEVTVSVVVNFGSDPVPDAVLELIITNSYDSEFFGNSATINPSFQPDVTISASTGVQTWPAGTYFDGNLAYSEVGSGPWANAHIVQVSTGFHVVEAGVGP